MTWELLHGDCRELMAAMPEGSVDAIVTDPPYGLSREPDAAEVLTHWLAGDDYRHCGNGFMGNSWDSFVPGPATWREALRVLKPGGFLLAFFGSRTYDLGTIAIRLAGFEVRDMVEWLYGSGFPKGGNRDGKGTCLKPAHEPIVMARKPCVGSARANIAAHGTGGLNVDACRVHGDDAQGGAYTVKRLKPGAALNATGGNWRPEEGPEYHGELKPGRWPANVIHDGSDTVLAQFPYLHGAGNKRSSPDKPRSGKEVTSFTRAGGDRAHRVVDGGRGGSAARFFYCAKASKADRDEGLDQFAPQAFVQFQTGNGESGAASSLSEGRDTQYRNIHPTVKPEALMRYLVRLVTPEGGTVLDPFAGSGSTGKAAILEDYNFVGCELTAEYLPIANARLCASVDRRAVEMLGVAAPPQADLFDGEAA